MLVWVVVADMSVPTKKGVRAVSVPVMIHSTEGTSVLRRSSL